MRIIGSVLILIVLAALFVGIVLITPLLWPTRPTPRLPEASADPGARRQPSTDRSP